MKSYRMSLLQTSLLEREQNVLVGTIRELASNTKILEFIENAMNDYTPACPYLLLIPETRQKPFTKSLLYKKVKGFLRENTSGEKYHIVFISNVLGICPEELADKEAANFELIGNIPDNSVMKRTANILTRYLLKTKHEYTNRLVYARSSYLECAKLASELSGINVESVLTWSDLIQLKRLGIRWMKIGLRMDECFGIFKRKFAEIVDNGDVQMKISEFR